MLARAAEELVSYGHADPMKYSPRQIMGWLNLGRARRRREMSDALSLQATAAQGSSRSIKEQLRRLSREDG